MSIQDSPIHHASVTADHRAASQSPVLDRLVLNTATSLTLRLLSSLKIPVPTHSGAFVKLPLDSKFSDGPSTVRPSLHIYKTLTCLLLKIPLLHSICPFYACGISLIGLVARSLALPLVSLNSGLPRYSLASPFTNTRASIPRTTNAVNRQVQEANSPRAPSNSDIHCRCHVGNQNERIERTERRW